MIMGLYILGMWYLVKKKVKVSIYLIQMIFTLETGKETVWMVMEHIFLLQVKYIKASSKKGSKRVMENVFIPMGSLMKASGVKIVKSGLERLNSQMK